MMSLSSRRELLLAVARRYLSASKSEKGLILDEFVKATEFNRKYAIRLIRASGSSLPWPKSKASPIKPRRRKYGADIEPALLSVWRLSGGLCPKRLMPFLSVFVERIEHFNEISLTLSVRQKLLQMSAATAERILGSLRRSLEHGLCTTKAGTLLRHQIPIRTYEDWTEDRPGFFEIDLVAHCGNTVAGEFVHTLTMTDISTGWTEEQAVENRSKITVTNAIETISKRLPFPLLGIDSDNGAEFINSHLKRYCDDHGITFTRCRPYKKNDQCHVEQKNGALVRPLVGYSRYEGKDAADYLNTLYLIHRLCVNFFEPSMKLIGKTRTGAKVKKTYDEAKTPWQRVVDCGCLGTEKQQLVNEYYLRINPAKLRRELNDLELKLRRFAVNNPQAPSTTQQADPESVEGSGNGKA